MILVPSGHAGKREAGLLTAMDSAGISESRKDWEEKLDSVGDVTVNMTGVEKMDGAGVGALSFLYKRLAARGDKLVVTGAAGQPLEIIRELGLARLLGLPEKNGKDIERCV